MVKGIDIIKPGSVSRFARQKLLKPGGRVSAEAVALFCKETTCLLEAMIEFGFVNAVNAKRKTILENDARQGVENALAATSPQILESLIWKLESMKTEVEKNGDSRRTLFSRSFAPEQKPASQNAGVEKS